ncbi:MAG: hydroxymethylbilane synthase [Chloroflexi bacterium]|nr:MAG: hydroxymethylbilane synthase [Chloroflexota bacterium]
MSQPDKLRVGSRTSRLAMWQTEHIIQLLQAANPGLVCEVVQFITKGDKTLHKPLPQIGGKGLFTAELEAALREGQIDIAVHSLKDLPVEDAPGLTVGAIVGRADVRDVLVAPPGTTLKNLPHGAVVGTSSHRRRAQLLAARPDLVIRPIRGNVDTRVRKVQSGEYEATVLAAAGVTRLGLTAVIADYLPLSVMLPAPGQGALAVQCRENDVATRSLLGTIENREVRTAVTAERAFLDALGGGCSAPIAAYAQVESGHSPIITLTGFVASLDGRRTIRVRVQGHNPHEVAAMVAEQAQQRGAEEILAHV